MRGRNVTLTHNPAFQDSSASKAILFSTHYEIRVQMNSSTPPQVQYSTIDAENEIRILVLQPAMSLPDPLHATIITRSMLDSFSDHLSTANINYEAVSYRWVVPELTNELRRDGGVIMITAKVDSMLRRLRKEQPRNFLIDAICINQEDEEEKSLQVRQIGISSLVRRIRRE